MSKWQVVENAWREGFSRLLEGEFLVALRKGSWTLDHYKGFLRETYYNTSKNPKLIALFQAHLRSDHHALEARLLKHAAQEVGHHELALSDLRALGENVDDLREDYPLATTEALGAFITYQIQHRNPLAFLGYMYHLESIALALAGQGQGSLERLGVPQEARSFLKEHADADEVHMQWNRQNIDAFVRTEADLKAVLFGTVGTCELHGVMFQGIVNRIRRSDSWRAADTTDARIPLARGN